MNANPFKEISPLTQNDCFTIFSRVKKELNAPLHFHEEYELTLLINAKGAKRMVGDSAEEINDYELVLVGPQLSHTWHTHQCSSEEITEVTIQWHKDLFNGKTLQRSQLSLIRRMFDRSLKGILFPRETAMQLAQRILAINQMQGFDSILELMSILHQLSTARSMRVLSSGNSSSDQILHQKSKRIEMAFEFMHANFHKPLSLKDLAKLVHMTEVSFSRFIRKRTGNTFVDHLNEIRLSHASRMLIETSYSISEISTRCGFNNISNFNRFFRKKKNCNPKEFREKFSGSIVFI